jgi:hypothetical protein
LHRSFWGRKEKTDKEIIEEMQLFGEVLSFKIIESRDYWFIDVLFSTDEESDKYREIFDKTKKTKVEVVDNSIELRFEKVLLGINNGGFTEGLLKEASLLNAAVEIKRDSNIMQLKNPSFDQLNGVSNYISPEWIYLPYPVLNELSENQEKNGFLSKYNCHCEFKKRNCCFVCVGDPNNRRMLIMDILQKASILMESISVLYLDLSRFDPTLVRIIYDYFRIREGSHVYMKFDSRTKMILLYGNITAIQGLYKKARQYLGEINAEYKQFAKRQNKYQKCSICLNDIDFYNAIYLKNCGHFYCAPCIQLYFQSELNKQPTISYPLKCIDCGTALSLDDLYLCLGGEYKYFDRLLYRLLENKIMEKNNFKLKFCEFPECGAIYDFEKAQKTPYRTCLNCKNTLCTKCGMDINKPEHTKLCVSMEFRSLQKEDKIVLLKSTSACPICGYRYQKAVGCNHMVCTFCSPPTHFCYLCQTQLDPEK